METNSTKQLAKQLGLLKRRSSTLPKLKLAAQTNAKLNRKEQIFNYVVVLDFESTCWENKENRYSPEIIEFPAVLVNLSTGEIESKFQYYVEPTEHRKLSLFCTSLTGITQDTVDNGVPIGTCLKLFSDWLYQHINEKHIFFPSKSKPSGYHKAVFVTWSDWDLNTCLQYECKRKKITYTPHLKSWIDLRKTYRSFYDRKPEGLNGALKEVGIEFEGRQHCGLDDAVNTATLLLTMVKDGCVLKATKSLILSLEECNRYDDLSINIDHGGELSSEPPDRSSSSSSSMSSNIHQVGPKTSAMDTHQVGKVYSKTSGLNSKILVGVVNNVNTETCSEHVTKLNSHDTSETGTVSVGSKNKVDNLNLVKICGDLKSDNMNQMGHLNPLIPNINVHETTLNKKIQHSEATSNQLRPGNRKSLYKLSTSDHDSAYKIQIQVTPTSILNKKTLTVSSQGNMCLQKPKLKVGMSKHTPIGKRPSSQNQNNPLTVTPPLCDCGRRCKRKKVVNPGPNIGRVFYTCPSKTVAKSIDMCKFFKWENNNLAMSSLSSNVTTQRLGMLPLPKLGTLPLSKAKTSGSELLRDKRVVLKNQYKSLFHVN